MVFRIFTSLLSTLVHGDCSILTADISLPTPPVTDQVPILQLLQLALPELPDRQANGLTGIAIFMLRYTADPVRHSPTYGYLPKDRSPVTGIKCTAWCQRHMRVWTTCSAVERTDCRLYDSLPLHQARRAVPCRAQYVCYTTVYSGISEC